METKIIKEIDSYSSKYHFKIGITFSFFLIIILFISRNVDNNDSIPFEANFNYIEGINMKTEVQLAGIKIGDIKKIMFSQDGVVINGQIDRKYDIPKDSIIKIKSNGIFGRKVLSVEPGFGEYMDKSKQKYVFTQTQDSYSVDMFLRYLNNFNE